MTPTNANFLNDMKNVEFIFKASNSTVKDTPEFQTNKSCIFKNVNLNANVGDSLQIELKKKN